MLWYLVVVLLNSSLSVRHHRLSEFVTRLIWTYQVRVSFSMFIKNFLIFSFGHLFKHFLIHIYVALFHFFLYLIAHTFSFFPNVLINIFCMNLVSCVALLLHIQYLTSPLSAYRSIIWEALSKQWEPGQHMTSSYFLYVAWLYNFYYWIFPKFFCYSIILYFITIFISIRWAGKFWHCSSQSINFLSLVFSLNVIKYDVEEIY